MIKNSEERKNGWKKISFYQYWAKNLRTSDVESTTTNYLNWIGSETRDTQLCRTDWNHLSQSQQMEIINQVSFKNAVKLFNLNFKDCGNYLQAFKEDKEYKIYKDNKNLLCIKKDNRPYHKKTKANNKNSVDNIKTLSLEPNNKTLATREGFKEMSPYTAKNTPTEKKHLKFKEKAITQQTILKDVFEENQESRFVTITDYLKKNNQSLVHIELNNIELEVAHHMRRIISNESNFNRDLKGFHCGNAHLFPKLTFPLHGIDMYSPKMNKRITVKFQPYILTLHNLAKIVFGRHIKLSGSRYDRTLKLFTKASKRTHYHCHNHEDYGNIVYEFPILKIEHFHQNNLIALYPTISLIEGIIKTGKTLLYDSDILEQLKESYKNRKGGGNIGPAETGMLLKLFNHIVQIRDQNKTHHFSMKKFIDYGFFPKKLVTKREFGTMRKKIDWCFGAMKDCGLIALFDFEEPKTKKKYGGIYNFFTFKNISNDSSQIKIQ